MGYLFDSVKQGEIFMIMLLVAWLVGLNFALVSLAKTRVKSNYSRTIVPKWLILSGIFSIPPVIFSFLAHFRVISIIKMINTNIPTSLFEQAKLEALFPLKLGIFLLVILCIPITITLIRMNRLPYETLVSKHETRPFSPFILIVLHFISGGMSSHIKFAYLHGQLPKVRSNDPGTSKAFWYLLIPFFNIYWYFFSYLRLSHRLNEQLNERRISYQISKRLVAIILTLSIIPIVNIIPFFVLFPICIAKFQIAANHLSPKVPVLMPELKELSKRKISYSRKKLIFDFAVLLFILFLSLSGRIYIFSTTAEPEKLVTPVEIPGEITEKDISKIDVDKPVQAQSTVKPGELVAPVEIPEETPEEDISEMGVEGGVEGGVVGGVLGGVKGGVMGGVVGEVEGPIRALGGIKPPKLIKEVEPIYPEIARQARVEGVVIVEATTDIYGRVQRVMVLRSIPLLDQAAIDAVRQWVYEPMIVNGKPKGVIFTVPVPFILK